MSKMSKITKTTWTLQATAVKDGQIWTMKVPYRVQLIDIYNDLAVKVRKEKIFFTIFSSQIRKIFNVVFVYQAPHLLNVEKLVIPFQRFLKLFQSMLVYTKAMFFQASTVMLFNVY